MINEIIKKLKQAALWIIDNGYEIALSIVCFLVATHILGPWACWAVLFGSFLVWGLKKTGVLKSIREKFE